MSLNQIKLTVQTKYYTIRKQYATLCIILLQQIDNSEAVPVDKEKSGKPRNTRR